MSSNRDFRFTVEQIWLLQRLRGSGLSRDQIVAGLEDLDRLDGAGSNPQTHFSSFSNNLGKFTQPLFHNLTFRILTQMIQSIILPQIDHSQMAVKTQNRQMKQPKPRKCRLQTQ